MSGKVQVQVADSVTPLFLVTDNVTVTTLLNISYM